MTSRQQLLRDGYALLRKPAGGEDGEEGAEGAEGGVGGRGDTIEGGRPGSRRKGALFSVVRDGRGRVVEVEGLHVAMLEASSCRPVRATTHSPRPAGSAHSPMPACDVLFTRAARRAGPNTGGLCCGREAGPKPPFLPLPTRRRLHLSSCSSTGYKVRVRRTLTLTLTLNPNPKP